MIKMRYEIILNQSRLDTELVRKIFVAVFSLLKIGEIARILAIRDGVFIRFYLETETRSQEKRLPIALPNLDEITINFSKVTDMRVISSFPRIILQTQKNLVELFNKYDEAETLVITGRKLGTWGKFSEALYTKSQKYIFPVANFYNLTIDFRKSPNYLYTKKRKYLKLEKSLHFFNSDQRRAIAKVDAYPYLGENYYLPLDNYDYIAHSLVIGATGSGKTKFLSNLIEQINKRGACRVIAIDPHAALKEDIGGLKDTKIFDFETDERAMNLFKVSAKDSIVGTDITLSLIKSILADSYNSKLERLARAAIFLLIEKGDFNFANLRRLISDAVYRNQILSELNGYLPESIENFFGHDFNELKSESYNEAFAPLVSLIDELQFLPAFYHNYHNSLEYELFQNKIMLFSLDQSKLGQTVQKTIVGLILNQLFILMQGANFDEHIIIVIDEIAVVENPIIMRFLSEARKFNVSVVLASQYFSQITNTLRQSIFANVANYFCFRVAYEDAKLLTEHLNIDYSDESLEAKYKLLSTLPARKACLRLSRNGVLGSAFLAETLDFAPKSATGLLSSFNPASRIANENARASTGATRKYDFESTVRITDLMRENSTSRRKING